MIYSNTPVIWGPNLPTGVTLTSGATNFDPGPWVSIVPASTTGQKTLLAIMTKGLVGTYTVDTPMILEVGKGTGDSTTCVVTSFPFAIGSNLVGCTWHKWFVIPIELIPTNKEVWLRLLADNGSPVTIENVFAAYTVGIQSDNIIQQRLYRDPPDTAGVSITSPVTPSTWSAWTEISTVFPAREIEGAVWTYDNTVNLPDLINIEFGVGVTSPVSIGEIATVVNGVGSFIGSTLPYVVPVSFNDHISLRFKTNVASVEMTFALAYYGSPSIGCGLIPPSSRSGIYYIERNKRDDTYFTNYSPIRTIDVKIP